MRGPLVAVSSPMPTQKAARTHKERGRLNKSTKTHLLYCPRDCLNITCHKPLLMATVVTQLDTFQASRTTNRTGLNHLPRVSCRKLNHPGLPCNHPSLSRCRTMTVQQWQGCNPNKLVFACTHTCQKFNKFWWHAACQVGRPQSTESMRNGHWQSCLIKTMQVPSRLIMSCSGEHTNT